jgi:hypothetical protein
MEGEEGNKVRWEWGKEEVVDGGGGGESQCGFDRERWLFLGQINAKLLN